MSTSDEKRILTNVDTILRRLAELYQEDPERDPALVSGDSQLFFAFSALLPLLLPLAENQPELLWQMVQQLFLQRLAEPGAGKEPAAAEEVSFCLAASQRLFALRSKASDAADGSPVLPGGLIADEANPGPRDSQTAAEGPESPKTDTASAEPAKPAQNASDALSGPSSSPDSAQPSSQQTPPSGEPPKKRLARLLAWCFPGEALLLDWPFRSCSFDAYLPRRRLALRLGEEPKTYCRDRLWLKKEKIDLLWIPEPLLGDPRAFRRRLRPDSPPSSL